MKAKTKKKKFIFWLKTLGVEVLFLIVTIAATGLIEERVDLYDPSFGMIAIVGFVVVMFTLTLGVFSIVMAIVRGVQYYKSNTARQE